MPGVDCALATTCALSFGKTSPQDCQIKKGHPLLPEAALPTSVVPMLFLRFSTRGRGDY